MIDSVSRMFLEECKYIFKEKKMFKYIIKDIEVSYNESDKEDSDEENSNEGNSDEEIILCIFRNFFYWKIVFLW